MPAPNQLTVQDWGLIDYSQALKRQEELVEAVHQSQKGVLVFCTHPPVVTLGRKTTADDLMGWKGETVEVSRGGRATYHGPSQLVIYPILPIKDVQLYLRSLERVLVRALEVFELKAQTSVEQRPEQAEDLNNTGVWVGSQKLASIGIAVRKWISYHGIALNVSEDPQAFQGIKPCGFSQSTMTSLETVLGINPELDNFKLRFQRELEKAIELNFKLESTP